MQTIKGLIALVLVAVAVFVVVGRYDIRSQDWYAAKLRMTTAIKAGTARKHASTVAAKAGGMTTNAVHQARQKAKNASL